MQLNFSPFYKKYMLLGSQDNTVCVKPGCGSKIHCQFGKGILLFWVH